MRSTYGSTTYGASPAARDTSASPFAPTTCSTCTPASARLRSAPDTDWLSRRAPWEPP